MFNIYDKKLRMYLRMYLPLEVKKKCRLGYISLIAVQLSQN